MPQPRYMRTKIDILTNEIIEKYNLRDIFHNEYVCLKIKMDRHGLPEAGILVNKLLKKQLGKHGYYKYQFTPVL